MLLRLVSPVRRSGTSNVQFVKRLPVDLTGRLVGVKVLVPVGEEIIPYTIPKSGIRLSLRTGNPAEAKARQGELAAYFEKLFQAYRDNRPVSLTRRHAVALSRALYEAWAGGEGRERTVALEQEISPSGSLTGRFVRAADDPTGAE